MHASSYERMKEFVSFLDANSPIKVLDIGSGDVNGSYRPLFEVPSWEYTGLDLAPGRNVDIVARGLYDWSVPEQYDVVISGQCLEHVEDVKLWAESCRNVLAPGGVVCIIAPWACNYHRYPVDCWRVLPDGMKWILESILNLDARQVFLEGDVVGDCVGIGVSQPTRSGILAKEIPHRFEKTGRWKCVLARL